MTDAEQTTGPGQLPADEDEEDLEDGEIESDEDEAPVPVPVVVPVKVPAKADPSPPKKVQKSNRNVGDDQEDFATSLERQLAQALGKPAPASPSTQTADDNNKRGKDDRPKASEKSRKRKRRNESPARDRDRDKNRKSKKNRPEESTTAPPDDMDDFEMMNVRGGSPPPPAPVPAAAPNSDGNDSDRSYSSYGSSYDSGDYHRRQRRRNRAADRSSRRENRRREKEQEKQRRGAASGGGGGGGGGASVVGRNEGGRHHRDHGNDSDREQEAPPRGRDEYKNHPRKMELCKFYLMECCAKREKCLYMHQDFPCKYYYTSSECTQKDCKFGHGKPLTDALRAILMKHLETAPKEILGDFPRLGRELANQKIRSRHKELCMKFNMKDETAPQHNSSHTNANGGGESSHMSANLPDLYSKPPPPIRGKGGGGGAPPQMDKGKKSRWCEQMRGNNSDGRPMTGANAIPVTNNSNFAKVAAGPPPSSSSSSTLIMSETAKSLMSLRNLTNVLTQDQIEKLSAIGIETLDQVKHLTVLQLTEIGLSISQLSEIQTNAMQMEKLGTAGGSTPVPVPTAVVPAAAEIVEPEPEKKIVPEVAAVQSTVILPTQPPPPLVGDTDMRIVPTVNQDVDMRYLGPPPALAAVTPAALSQPPPQLIKDVVRSRLAMRAEIASPDASEERMEPNAVVDYSQYLKEANLVVAVEEDPKAPEEEQKVTPAYGGEEEAEEEDDDDSDDGLKICNDEEEEERDDEEGDKEGKGSDPAPPVIPSVSYWPMNLASLTSLNKIDLSSSVTQMMNAEKKSEQPTTIKPEAFVSMYNRTEEVAANKDTSEPFVGEAVVETVRAETQCRDSDSDTGSSKKQSLDPRDPRNRDPRNSREAPKSPPSIRQPQVVVRPSIYDRDEEEDEDSGSSRSPPLKPDMDMRIGDVDLRMPFKPMLQNYVPATEIDGSFSSHLPIVYKVFEWDVPKPNFKDIRRRVAPDNSQDPRLQRIFGLEDGDGNKKQQYDAEEAERASIPNTDPRTAAASFDPRMDPRRRKEATIQSPGGPAAPLATGLDIQLVLQKSSWYTDLGSKNKIFVNQQLAVLTSELKHYHEEVIISGPRPFDLSRVFEQSPMLGNVLQQLGILVDEKGAIQPMGGAHMGGVGGGGGVGVSIPPPNMNMNDPNMMMPELAVMIQQQQQQQRMFNMNPALMHQMQGQGIQPGLLGMAPPNLGFAGPPPFDGNGPPPPVGGDMGNYMMNNSYNGNGNDNMGPGGRGPPPMGMGGGGGFFQHQNNRGGFRNNSNNNNNMGGRNDRWVHNNMNNRGGGNDGRRHNSRRD